jgi:Uma2 family endonuclease
MESAIPLLTADDFLRTTPTDDRVELVDGVVVPMTPAKGAHGLIVARLLVAVGAHAQARTLGGVFSEATGFTLDAGTVVCPDVAFVATGRLPAGGVSTQDWMRGAPDLAAEVLSPDDRASDVAEKVDRYLAAGARVVWVLDPKTRTVIVYEAGGAVQRLREDGMLEGGAVLPGFAHPVAALFAGTVAGPRRAEGHG